MAQNSTIYKAHLSVADIDRDYYAEHSLTLACHPSETRERLMVRLLVFALNADENMTAGAGMTDNDQPDFWIKDYTGAIKLWVEAGQPDERRMLKACGRSDCVRIYAYASSIDLWWNGVSEKVARADNLEVYAIDPRSVKELAVFADRSIDMQLTVQDGEIWVRNESHAVSPAVVRLN